jgi:hypothetical protein
MLKIPKVLDRICLHELKLLHFYNFDNVILHRTLISLFNIVIILFINICFIFCIMEFANVSTINILKLANIA